MTRKLFVGNLPYDLTDDQLREIFERCGEVLVATIPQKDGQSRGFGFVEYASQKAVPLALRELDRFAVGSKRIVVNIARERGGGGWR